MADPHSAPPVTSARQHGAYRTVHVGCGDEHVRVDDDEHWDAGRSVRAPAAHCSNLVDCDRHGFVFAERGARTDVGAQGRSGISSEALSRADWRETPRAPPTCCHEASAARAASTRSRRSRSSSCSLSASRRNAARGSEGSDSTATIALMSVRTSRQTLTGQPAGALRCGKTAIVEQRLPASRSPAVIPDLRACARNHPCAHKGEVR